MKRTKSEQTRKRTKAAAKYGVQDHSRQKRLKKVSGGGFLMWPGGFVLKGTSLRLPKPLMAKRYQEKKRWNKVKMIQPWKSHKQLSQSPGSLSDVPDSKHHSPCLYCIKETVSRWYSLFFYLACALCTRRSWWASNERPESIFRHL